MAQIVGYHDNNVVFEQGPFVICNALGNGWRIEVEQKGHCCPVLPDASIYKLLQCNYFPTSKSNNQAQIARAADWLNNQVTDEKIVLVGNCWQVAPDATEISA